MALRVGIVEDDSLLRSTMTALLDARDDVEVVSSRPTGQTILEQAAEGILDVALLDVHLGDGPTGFDIARTLRQLMPLVGIVFLSSVKDPRLLGQRPAALPTGARYLLKSEVADVEELVEQLAASTSHPVDSVAPAPPSIPFTEAQIEILRLVGQGHSNAVIAKRKFVTEGAVEMAVSRLAKHLGLREAPGTNRRVHIANTFAREMGWTQ